MFKWAGLLSLLHSLWGRGQRGNNSACQLVSSPLSNRLGCQTGSISHRGNPSLSPRSALSLSFPLKSVLPLRSQAVSPAPLQFFWVSQGGLPYQSGCSGWFFFFNSLVVRVPCSLIFWCFWVFVDFRFAVILLLVVWGSKGFLSLPPSWPEHQNIFILNVLLCVVHYPKYWDIAVHAINPQSVFLKNFLMVIWKVIFPC